ncbi:shieldin complex subunit 2 isoform X3 [Echinops telfairi]|uniref:Shieldin complex subunit 2 isoform X3 n=1 Tax=Echinops telfairi TaxID=9371 RepID=A0AC55DCD5_ECHTE|nr:shieldin complex subunit 2 isoform X3 [Echinops telfairi]
MTGGSQVHLFWGAPTHPLKMTVSHEPAPSVSTTHPWGKVQLLYSQHAIHLKDEEYRQKTLESHPALDSIGSPGLNSHCPVHSRERSVHLEADLVCCVSETQNINSQKSLPSGMNEVVDSSVRVCGFRNRIQHLTGEEKNQRLVVGNKKITVEQHEDLPNICTPNLQRANFPLDHNSILDSMCSTKQINIGSEALESTCVSRTPHEVQNPCLEFSKMADKPSSKEIVMKDSDLNLSTDTEFLSILTSSQVAFLAQRKHKGKNSLNKRAINTEIGPKASREEIVTKNNLVWPGDTFTEGESGQNEAYSLELFSPVCQEKNSSHDVINPNTDLEGIIRSQQLFRSEEKLLPNEICIESYSSGILCSQLNTFHKSPIKRSRATEDLPGHSEAPSKVLQVSKKTKLLSNARALPVALDQRSVPHYALLKKTALIKDCDCKDQKYNCLVMVLSLCHVKEINIKSGPNSGSKVPLATMTVIDQSEIKKKVSLWRTTAFWALTVFPGDIIFLTDVTIHEDQWIGETVLQSTFTSQLLNLGNYSSVQPEEYSSVFSAVALQDLLAYVSSKHSCLRDLPERQPQKVSNVEFVELEHLQPETLVHAALKVVDITILTEALYNYRGQKQRKVMLTVEQTQGQHYVLVLWGPGATWYPQLQRKKDYIWEFKYLFVQRNCISGNLELHTTPWSSYECLFDDEIRAIEFKAKFQKSLPSLVKISDLATHLADKCSGVVLVSAQILELVFPITATQEQQIALNAQSSLKSIFASVPNITYTGCAECGCELETDENRIYKQCLSCLPFTLKKIYYSGITADGEDPPQHLSRMPQQNHSTFLRHHLWDGGSRLAPRLVGTQRSALPAENSEPFCVRRKQLPTATRFLPLGLLS